MAHAGCDAAPLAAGSSREQWSIVGGVATARNASARECIQPLVTDADEAAEADDAPAAAISNGPLQGQASLLTAMHDHHGGHEMLAAAAN